MPRKRKGGNRGESPDKFSSFSVGQGGESEGVIAQYNAITPLPGQTSWVDVARQGIGGNSANIQSVEQDRTFHHVQDMFPKVDAEVIYMVLSESNWKVDEAIDKLVQICPESDGEIDVSNPSSNTFHGATQGINIPAPPSNMYDNTSLRSRLPSGNASDISCQLPILSPKTPGTVGTNYPDSFAVSVQHHVQPGMKALNSYAMNYSHPLSAHGKDIQGMQTQFTSVMHNANAAPLYSQSQIAAQNIYNSFGGIIPNYPPPPITNATTNVSPTSVFQNPNYVATGNSQMSANPQNNNFHGSNISNHVLEPVRTQSHIISTNSNILKHQDSLQKEALHPKMGATQSEQKVIAKKRGRKTTMSLNPEEREALENLIEDVIIGGIGEGVMDSGESSACSSDTDEESKLQTETSGSDVMKEEEFSRGHDHKGDAPTTPKKDSQKSKIGKDKQKGFEQGQKVYPPQLKVAVKHMKNLPPRFLRKIQTNKDDKPETEIETRPKTMREKPIPEVVEPKEVKPEIKKKEDQQIALKERDRANRSKEERMIESKKKVRGMLLEGLDHYLEQSVDSDEKKQSEDPASDKEVQRPSIKNEILSDSFSHSAPSSAQVSPNTRLNITPQKNSADLSPVDPAIKAQGPTITPQIRPNLPGSQAMMHQPRFLGHSSPGMVMNRMPSPVYMQSAAVNCEELEREMFKDGTERMPVSQPNNYVNVQQNLQQLTLASFPNAAHLHPNQQYHLHSQLQQMQSKSQFSVDAPEFVPRTFTPGATAGGHQMPQHGLPPEMMTPPPLQQIPHTMPIHVSKSVQPVGRLSPHVQAICTMAGAMTPQEHLVTAAHAPPQTMGRNSPIPGGPAFILPKVPQNVPSPHTAVPPPGAPGVGLVYAPVATAYPQFRPAGYPQYQLQGPFLVQAWPGGRKPHTNPLHPSHPASHQKTSGMGIRGRSGVTQKGNFVHSQSGTTQKMPHRGQHEMSPQQAKEKVDTLMKQGKKVLVILRGLPGSGKSTIAKEIHGNGQILTTDDFFTENGVYDHDSNRLGEAHEWNQRRAKEAIEKTCNPIIIDNTNTQYWEMKPYVGLALKYDYHIEIIEPSTAWKFKLKELFQKNTHNVQLETLQKMYDRYEKHVTIEKVMGQYDSKKKEEGDKQADDGDGEKRTPRRRRRRRRRRKKKAAVDGNSDSEKAEDEQSSDEEQTSMKQDMMMSSMISTDTTENELERNHLENTDMKNMESTQSTRQPMKISSSSLESDDFNPVVNTLCLSKNEACENIIEENNLESQERQESVVTINSSIDNQTEHHSRVTGEKAETTGLCDEVLEEEGNFQEIKIIDQVKSALRAELGKYIKDQILDTLVNDEINKLDDVSIDSLGINGNGITVSKTLAKQISEKLITEHDSNLWFDEEKAKEEWEFVNMEPEYVEEADKNVAEKGGEIIELTGTAIKPRCVSEKTLDKNYKSSQISIIETDKSADIDHSTKTLMQVEGCTVEQFSNESPSDKCEQVEKKYWESTSGEDCYTVSTETKMVNPRTSCNSAVKNLELIEKNVVKKEHMGVHNDVIEPLKEQRSPKKKEKVIPNGEETDVWTENKGEMSKEHTTSQRCNNGHVLSKDGPQNFIDSSMKDNLLSSDWSFPAYSQGVESLQAGGDVQIRVEHSNAETNTTANDFCTLQKLLQGSLDSEQLKKLSIKTAVVRVINHSEHLENEGMSSMEGSPRRPISKLYLDKGCMTDEVEDDKEGITFLKACFPAVPEEDLEDILSTCDENTEWAINILLDSGYELCDGQTNNNTENNYDGQIVNIVDNKSDMFCEDFTENSKFSNDNKTVKTDEDSNESLETVASCSKKIENSAEMDQTPSPLLDLSHGVLQSVLNLNDNNLLEQVSNQSLRRLHSIEEFSKRTGNDPSASCGSPFELESLDSDSSLNTSICIKDAIEEISETVFPNVKKSLQLTSIDNNEKDAESTTKFYLHVNGELDEEGEMKPGDMNESNKNVSDLEIGDLTLNLSKDLAMQLVQEFGPVGFHISPESLSKFDLQVRLNRKTAKQIHQSWALTLQEKFSLEEAAIQKMMKEDEELARRLQAEEDSAIALNMTRLLNKGMKEPSQSPSSSPKRPPPIVGLGGGTATNVGDTTSNGKVKAGSFSLHQTPSLKEIMEEEFVLEMSKKDYVDELYGDRENSLSTKLKRQKLHEVFSNIDSSALDEIFRASGYSLEATVRLVEGTLGEVASSKKPVNGKDMTEYDEGLIESSRKENQQMWLGVEDEFDGNCTGKVYQTFNDPSYQNYRAEASLHYKLRHECFQKAQEAYRRGMKAVASFYSQQGHLHTEKLKQANTRAAEKIIEYRRKQLGNPFTIDLHGLHVDEALHVLQREIQIRECEMQSSSDKRMRYLSVVTGQGKHSRGGQARIKPAVVDYLKRNKYSYAEPHGGLLRVSLKFREP